MGLITGALLVVVLLIAALAAQLIHEGGTASSLGVGTDTTLDVAVPLVHVVS